MDRLFAVILGGALGWFIGTALHVPIWRTWQMGDRVDIALCSAMLVFILTRREARHG